VTVTFRTPTGTNNIRDWIALYRVGADNRSYLRYQYTNWSTTGSHTFTMPVEKGQYDFRYLKNDGYTSVAQSGTVVVQ
jgi:hypothetical protein